MQYKKKSNAIGTIAIVLVLVLLVGGLGFLSKGFKDWNVKDWFNKADPTSGGGVVDGDGNEMKPGTEHKMPSNMVFKSPMLAGASEGITLKATISPTSAENKKVDWSVLFVNPVSAWASGKTVSTYVTVTPTEDGALTANVKCLAAFGEQIKIIVTARSNPAANAECAVDYEKRFTKIAAPKMVDVDNNSNVIYSFADSVPSMVMDFVGDEEPVSMLLVVNPDYTGQVGTIEQIVYPSRAYITLSKELREDSSMSGFIMTKPPQHNVNGVPFDFSTGFLSEFFGVGRDAVSLKAFNDALTSKGYAAFTLTILMGEVTQEFSMKAHVYGYGVVVTDITLDDNTIVF